MTTDDLAPLLAAIGAEPDVGYHSGRIIEWDQLTGANTVNVAGAPIPNLPMLNIGDVVNLKIGDTVGILRFKSAYFILGRVTTPGSSILASQALDVFAHTSSASGYTITTTPAAVVSVQVPVPAWANRAVVHATVHATGRNDRGITDWMYARPFIAGFPGASQLSQGDASPNPSYAHTSASHALVGVTTPGSAFEVTAEINSFGGTWTANGLNQCDLTVSVTHTRVPE